MSDLPPPAPRWPYLVCRATTAGLGVLGVTQAVLAGSFLNGHYDAVRMHLMTAMVMVGLSVVQAVVVVFLRRAGGPRSVLILGLVLPLLLAGQGGLGMGRVIGLHVPLGALFVAGLLRLAAWVWRTPLPPGRQAVRQHTETRPAGALS